MISDEINREVIIGATFYATLMDCETGNIDGDFVAKNIVLDSAYQYMASSGEIPWNATNIHLGEGQSIPNASQSGLDSHLVSTSSTTRERDPSNPLKWTISTYFSSEQANGPGGTASSIREIAAGWGNGIFLNRAIFRDLLGEPVTISKSPSQVLGIRMDFEIRRV